MSSDPIRIAIVGAGPGGLTLARLLHVAGIKTSLFERESSATKRPQGGTLDLHTESRQLALARAGLTDAFLRIARYEDQGSRLYTSDGRLLLVDDDMTGDRPEVDRTALRDLLLQWRVKTSLRERFSAKRSARGANCLSPKGEFLRSQRSEL